MSSREHDGRDVEPSDGAGDREPGAPFPERGLGGSSGIGGFAQDRPRPPGKPRGRGRPPRVYRRSDERIRDDVYDRLLAQDWIDADDVQVTVADGAVSLLGTVPSRQDQHDAEELAAQVLGVREIMNQLRIGGPPDAPMDQARAAVATSPGKTRPVP